MRVCRRSALAGLGAAAVCAALPSGAATVRGRSFRILRGSDRIGTQTLTVRDGGGVLTVEVAVDIRVRILGITAYRYEMRNTERWQGGRLVSIESRTNDDGTPAFARAERQGDALVVRGSAFEGTVPGDAATTTYWAPAFLRRGVWISTHDGTPLAVSARPTGEETLALATGRVRAEGWRVAGDLELDLYYAAGEWVANRFVARGERAEILAEDVGQKLSPLFTA